MDTQTAGHSDQGRRKNNEDFIAYFEPTDPIELKNYGSLYVVADGVGGAAKGERASQYAAQKTVFDYYQPYQPDPDTLDQSVLIEPLGYLRSILKQINEEIYEYATRHDTRMATTIIVVVVREGFLYVANVGDSRAYLIRSDIATQVNRDHSFVGEMVDHGEMTEAEAMTSSIKNKLTRSLGGDPDVLVETYEPLRLQSGDKILLCSDGLTRYALKEDVASMMMSGTPEEIATRFVQYANNKGGADNVSVIVISYQPSQMPESLTTPIIRPKDVDLETLQPTLLSHEINRGNKSRKRETDFLPMLNERKWQAAIVTFLLVFIVGLVVVGMAVFGGPMPPLVRVATETITGDLISPNPDISAFTLTNTPMLTTTQTLTSAPTIANDFYSITATNECSQNTDGLVYILDDPNNGKGIGNIGLHNSFIVRNLVKGQNFGGGDVWLEVRTSDNKPGWVWNTGCIVLQPGVTLNKEPLRFETPTPTITPVTPTPKPLPNN